MTMWYQQYPSASPRRRAWRRLAVVIASLLIAAVSSANDHEGRGAASEQALWSLLKGGGQLALLRHGSTDAGGGDPPDFQLDDCSTQRNLSAEGRKQARR